MTLYVIHARRTASPVLDFALLRLPTMRASIIGGFLFRLGIGALPFLLPLLMQVGFGLSPLRSGLVTFASAVGAMGMKTLAARIIRTFGFRNIMTINAVVSSVFLAACALFTIATPLLLIMILLVVGGFFRSLQFTAINTLAYAEVEPAQMSRATTLVSVNQQLAVSAGVAVGAFSVESTMLLHHVSELSAADFAPGVHRGRRSSRRFRRISSTRCPPMPVIRCRDAALSWSPAGARRRTGGDRRHRDRQRAGSAAGVDTSRNLQVRHARPQQSGLRRLRKLVCDAGHPRLGDEVRTWMAGSSPAMTRREQHYVSGRSFCTPRNPIAST